MRGETVAESATVPERPRLFRVIVDCICKPAGKLRDDKLEEMLKSAVTVTRNETLCTSEPLVLVTVTV